MTILQDKKGRVSYLRFFQWLLAILIFFFLGRMVWQDWTQVKEASFSLRPFPLVCSALVITFGYFIQIWTWYFITLKMRIAISWWDTLESWLYSQLGKYLPGKVWLLLSRFYFYESKGKSKKVTSVALYIETATIVIAAGLLFLVGLSFTKEVRSFYYDKQFVWLALLFLFACLSLYPRILQKIINWILIPFKKEPLSLTIAYTDILKILLISIFSWAVGGIGFYFFVESIFSISSSQILFIAGSLAFASLLGLIAVFAPSGLGVREGVLAYLLSHVMPAPVAVIISILTRIWMTFIEIGLIGVIYLVGKFRKGFGKRRDDRTERE